jgi:signal transduction histidine kinase
MEKLLNNSNFNKTFVKTSIIFMILVISFGSIIYQATKREMIESLSILLDTALEMNVKAIKEWIKDKKLDSRVMASQPLINKNILSLIELSKKPNVTSKALIQSPELSWLRKSLGPLSKAYGFYGFIIINKNGLQVGDLYDSAVGKNDLSKNSDFFEKTLNGETIVTLPFFSEIPLKDSEGSLRDSLPNIIISTPVINSLGETVGVLAFRLPPETGFSNLMSLSQFGDSGETYAFNKNAVMISESRFTKQLKEVGLIPNSAISQSILKISLRDPGKELPVGKLIAPNLKNMWPLTVMAKQATKGLSGTNTNGYRDYRGIEVVGSWKWLPNYNFGITHEIDKKEAYKTLEARMQLIILCLGGLLISGMALAWLYFKQGRIEAENFENILDLKKAQDERTRLYEMLNNLPILFHLQASDYSVPFANKMFRERFGDPETKSCYALMHKRTQPCETCTPFEIFNTNRTEESVWESFDGRTYLTVVTPFQDLDGTPLVLEMAVDITEQKKAEKALKISKNEAEIANKAKTEFLSRMSHEFRTPLNSIMGFSQILKSDTQVPLIDSQLKKVEQIIHSGGHILRLVEDVLDLGTIEQGKFPINSEEVSLIGLIEESFELVQDSAKEKNLRVTNNLPENEEIWVLADKERLKKVLLNLLTNAIKYNRDNGDIGISISLDFPGTARLKISDTGIGISEEKQNQIFKPFSAISPNQSFKEGVGLGLSISKLLMEMMNGKIYFESRVDKGSSFFIELPFVKKEKNSSENMKTKCSSIKNFNASIDKEISKEIELSKISIPNAMRLDLLKAAEIYNYTQLESLIGDLSSHSEDGTLVADLIRKHLLQYNIGEIIQILNKTKHSS